jgi:hypothetical protein
MKIDLLYFDGCPSWESALTNLEAALKAEGLEVEIQLIKVESDDQATQLKFLGSPSFHVNGQDWWPEERNTYNLSCRIYPTQQGIKGAPTVEMLREKIQAYRLA